MLCVSFVVLHGRVLDRIDKIWCPPPFFFFFPSLTWKADWQEELDKTLQIAVPLLVECHEGEGVKINVQLLNHTCFAVHVLLASNKTLTWEEDILVFPHPKGKKDACAVVMLFIPSMPLHDPPGDIPSWFPLPISITGVMILPLNTKTSSKLFSVGVSGNAKRIEEELQHKIIIMKKKKKGSQATTPQDKKARQRHSPTI